MIDRNRIGTGLTLAAALALPLTFGVGCQEEPAEEAAENVEDAASDAYGAAEDAADDAGDAAEDAADEASDALNNMTN